MNENIIGAIDIGSNSIRYLIGFLKDKHEHYLEYQGKTTRLGSQILNHQLHPDSIKSSLEYLEEVSNRFQFHQAKKVQVIATSALRENNAENFIQKAEIILNHPISVISGHQEAMLTFQGSKNLIQTYPNLLVDLGGGSTEFILTDEIQKTHYHSLPIGCVRYHDLFFQHQPITPLTFSEIEKHTFSLFDQLPFKLPKIEQLILTAGSATTLASIDLGLDQYISQKIHGYQMEFSQIKRWQEKLMTMTLSQIKQIKGLRPDRADIISAGVIIFHLIMKKFNIPQATISDQGILYGILRNFWNSLQ